jgi:hypothetical protein
MRRHDRATWRSRPAATPRRCSAVPQECRASCSRNGRTPAVLASLRHMCVSAPGVYGSPATSSAGRSPRKAYGSARRASLIRLPRRAVDIGEQPVARREAEARAHYENLIESLVQPLDTAAEIRNDRYLKCVDRELAAAETSGTPPACVGCAEACCRAAGPRQVEVKSVGAEPKTARASQRRARHGCGASGGVFLNPLVTPIAMLPRSIPGPVHPRVRAGDVREQEGLKIAL